MGHEKAVDGAVEDDYFEFLVSFDRGDGFVELRNCGRAKDVERRMIDRYLPVVG